MLLLYKARDGLNEAVFSYAVGVSSGRCDEVVSLIAYCSEYDGRDDDIDALLWFR